MSRTPSAFLELFVGGQSGSGAVDDNVRLCEFIYRNLGLISALHPRSIPTRQCKFSIPCSGLTKLGNIPAQLPTLHLKTLSKASGKSTPLLPITNDDYPALQTHALHYAKQLSQHGKYR